MILPHRAAAGKRPAAPRIHDPTVRTHDPTVCGLVPALDCDECQAARRAETEASERAEVERVRAQRQRAAVDRLARAAGITPEEFRDLIIDIAVAAAQEVMTSERRHPHANQGSAGRTARR